MALDPLSVDTPIFAAGWSEGTSSVMLGGGGGPGNHGMKNKVVGPPPPRPHPTPRPIAQPHRPTPACKRVPVARRSRSR